MFITPAYAQAAGGDPLGGFGSFVPLILIFVIFYFFLIRPQQRRAKEHKQMLEALRRGDEVITQGGLYGKVTKVKDDEAEVEIADGVKVRVVKGTIANVISKTEPANDA
ncbi:MAG: preprotein translocase subunit YajC [Paracoccaceae bacterium]